MNQHYGMFRYHSCPCRTLGAALALAIITSFLAPPLQAASDRVVISPAPGFNITWDGNNGGFNNPAEGAGPSNNVALASNGTVGIGSSEFGFGVHLVENINDGLYGNSESWISDFTVPDPDPWIGLSFPIEVDISSIAWGRDNGNTVSDACGGTCTDRHVGVYHLQYTLVPGPDASTPDTGEPFTGWADLGTVEYLPGVDNSDFVGYLRHRFEVDELGGPIFASGLRIKVSDPGIAIDELEINPIPDPIPPIDLVLDIDAESGFTIDWDGNEGDFSDPSDPALAPDNAARNGTAFGSSEFGAGVHFIANVNDGQYGNAFSWIANFTIPDPDPFIGINFGAVKLVTSFAWGRDNGNVAGDCCGGTLTDRTLGVYTLQITTRTDADETTPDTGDAATGWQTIGTIEYKGNDPTLFNSHLRHRYDLSMGGSPIQAAALRLKVPDAGIAIDEIEIGVETFLTTEGAPGFEISWDGNEGDFFSPDALALAPPNRALVSEGTIPFSSTDLGPELGIPFHVAGNLNDGLYGNANSWISGSGDPDPFAGLNFGGSVLITNIAWGRDNGNTVSDACGGTCIDRTPGTYLIQYTLVVDPDGSIPETGEPFTGWADIGTVTIGNALPPLFEPWLRHRFDVSQGGNPIEATGIRIKVPAAGLAGGTDIDEIEVNAPVDVPPPDLPIVISPESGFEIDWDGNEGNFSDPSNPALVPGNVAQSGTAFGSSEFGAGVHLIGNIIDGQYGNAFSWIANFTFPDPDPFVGINLGALTPITSIAWGRDNGNVAGDCCGGTLTDRALGLYTLQISTRTDADAATPDTGDAATGWQTIGTVEYRRDDPILFTSHLRHRFDVSSGGSPIEAAAIRIKVSDATMAIDEIEINPNQVIEQMLLVTAAAPGFEISWDGNEGDFFSPNVMAPVPPNRALASEGTIPFTSSDLGPVLGIPFHVAANLNDGFFGNGNSWISANGIGGSTDPDPFAGLNFGGTVLVTNIAWGRDNTSTFLDRAPGPYLLQYTLVPDPDGAIPETGEPFTGWADIGTVTYGNALPPIFQPHLRHRFELSSAGNPIEATGIRIKVPNGFTAIDEIEINTLVEPPPPTLPIVITPEAGFEIGYDGNDGEFEDPNPGAGPPPNRGLASVGTVPFGSSELGAFGHFIAEVNDGLYGNLSSWISGPGLGTDPNPFIGLNFGGLIEMTSIAWSRDNGDNIDNCCGGVVMDRSVDLYTIQVTQVSNPDAATPETGDASTGWTTVGTVDIQGSLPPLFRSWVRHEFVLSSGGNPVAASGIRIKVGNNGTAIDEIEVNALPNDPPVCQDVLAETNEDQAVDITLSGSDPEGGPVVFVLVDGPANGTASLSGDQVAYTPDPNHNGTDSLSYLVRDSAGLISGPCLVSITINPVNDAPTCEDTSAATDEDVPVAIALPVADVDGDALTAVLVSGPSFGTVTMNGSTATYTSNPNSCTDDSFTYKVVDSSGAESGVCNVSVSVAAVNDAPTGVVEVGPLSDLGDSVPGNIVISGNNANACVTLDASQSFDPDADSGCGTSGQIDYLWVSADGTPLGSGPVIEVCLSVGLQEVILVTDDGETTGETVVPIEVLTGCEAVEELIMKVNDSIVARKTKRPFIATLKTACAAFDRESVGSALNRLERAFKNKVQAQIGKDNPEVADEWIRIAQEIIDAYNREQSCEDCD